MSPLLERTVIILPSCFFLQQKDKPSVDGFIHVLDFLHESKFNICGMKMVLFSDSCAKDLKFMLSLDIEVLY